MADHLLKIALILSILTWCGGYASAVENRTQGQPEHAGAKIYKQMCARCHGPQGEGTARYSYPLTGDWSLERLAAYIDRTMPEDDPDKLDAQGARLVAEYIYDTFYSPAAYARLKPPRQELARLTVRQHRQSIADLIGSFRPAVRIDSQKQGLRGQYYNGRNFNPKSRLIDRLDNTVDFDFGTRGPDTETAKFDAHQFSIRWEGAVFAPETGLYEFIVRTDHAARLWVNNLRQPLIDAWVKSGNDTEYHGQIFLLAGRYYSVRLEFSKAKQGVDDSQKNPFVKPRPAFITLQWKRPQRPAEVIAARFLRPQLVPEVAVIDAPFPPDDRSFGWERGTTISREWEAAVLEAAIQASNYVAERIDELAGSQGGNRSQTLRRFAERFVERAFRRPLLPEEKTLYIDKQFTAAGTDEVLAIKRVVLLTLQSPRFLFPEAAGLSPDYSVAARLALTLWDSLPDPSLLEAAAAGRLRDPNEVRRQAERMLADPRAKTKLREFLLTWLRLDTVKELAKDNQKYPGFDAALAADLRTSLELTLEDWLERPDSDWKELFLSTEVYFNRRLAEYYGMTWQGDQQGFRKVQWEPEHRSGILTHPYLLAVLAYSKDSSPIHRGVFVGRALLGLPIRPPMDAFTPLPAELHPKLTTRQRVELQTRPPECAKCHSVMNPLGFPMEQFDAVGRLRLQDNGQPVDASGQYETRSGTLVRFSNARDLARFLADSPETHQAFATQLFHFLVQQSIRAYGVHLPEQLRDFLSQNTRQWRKLIIEIVVTAALAPTGRMAASSAPAP
ncbi:MAG: DUF1592 domain-containing protein [Thermogemmata sp.]|nr:DUF1592 domain-containing protein [Thermogemmata sp.]